MTKEDDINLGRLQEAVDTLKDDIKQVERDCDKCIIRRIVYGVVSVIGVALVLAVLALVVRGPVK